MSTIVCKFGGSSLADANQIKKVMAIVNNDLDRKYIVVSAPGKRYKDDLKITDALYACYDLAKNGEAYETYIEIIKNRYQDIIEGLEITFDLNVEIDEIKRNLSLNPNKDYMASRGEYLNAKIIATALNFEFIDPKDYVVFDKDRNLNSELTNTNLAKNLIGKDKVVVAGFYGADENGNIITFSRGGSDITGSIVARAVQADLYENWTDVSGMLRADPRIVDNPQVIDYISYAELRELSYMGFSVFHEEAVFPARKVGIPINIRNTNKPEDAGTMIVASLPKVLPHRVLTGVAGRKGFTSVQIEKTMMNSEVGFGAKLLQIFADNGVSFEHCPTGIDTISILVNSKEYEANKDRLNDAIEKQLKPDAMFAEDKIALIAVVGHGMAYSKGVAARIFSSIAEADVNIKMIDQGSSELNVIIAVKEDDYEKSIISIYNNLAEK